MRRPFLSLIAAAVVLAAALGPERAARADAAPDPAVTQVIETQLRAFAAGDRRTAYAQAAPSIQAMFPNAGIFMEMVKRGYSPLIAPKATDFLAPKPARGGRIEQRMALVDADGRSWTAVYTMERQPDGAWKIAGCRLERGSDPAV
ncbi:MAG: DUF4864 domain-containing protein [Marivibrio sp.]|uniref:DUF4864 domain-containing protein n=1 Tax=Marivibrio sp. TaxID=2039719 RepID=UPI0032EAE70B